MAGDPRPPSSSNSGPCAASRRSSSAPGGRHRKEDCEDPPSPASGPGPARCRRHARACRPDAAFVVKHDSEGADLVRHRVELVVKPKQNSPGQKRASYCFHRACRQGRFVPFESIN
jgi:hypothetical protein